jgi:hypothetical protein
MYSHRLVETYGLRNAHPMGIPSALFAALATQRIDPRRLIKKTTARRGAESRMAVDSAATCG